jgi:hypothetical protein
MHERVQLPPAMLVKPAEHAVETYVCMSRPLHNLNINGMRQSIRTDAA